MHKAVTVSNVSGIMPEFRAEAEKRGRLAAQLAITHTATEQGKENVDILVSLRPMDSQTYAPTRRGAVALCMCLPIPRPGPLPSHLHVGLFLDRRPRSPPLSLHRSFADGVLKAISFSLHPYQLLQAGQALCRPWNDYCVPTMRLGPRRIPPGRV